MNFYVSSIFFVVMGGWIFISNYKHILIMLLRLEVMILGLYSLIYGRIMLILEERIVLIVFLGFSVCEGRVGLGLLVMYVRYYGRDLFRNISSLWC